jgi:hypothetical protein
MVRDGEKRRLLLSNNAIEAYKRFRNDRHQSPEERYMDNLSKKGSPDRSKINMHEDYEVKYWIKELGVSKERLQQVVDKVGNSASAVRKELAA